MIMSAILVASLLTASSTYYSWYSPEIASHIMEDVVNGESHPYLDYDGDGTETILDAIGVLKRYHSNITNGNTITFDENEFADIMEENGIDAIYYEIDMTDQHACRCYSFTADKVMNIHIYYETENECSGFWVELNPFEERISVKDWAD